ncbi:uncharacterized protein LAESUDRAFT_710577 [Laetiporus sulphureus 93-53]|uniref:Uncharacterized protein n=1 Tax=Laetiporus sulphureus 93-53 TaxID=1314785 RepID=A0A165HRU6_9APHY|nr:uncharacterized protein LAESUDRAFT_710577 [Laetiporus sulphureus 93-53]KZT12100.1 hypothetical protein LAESUDRAFT_710577 [Laetiporus sulphureus 93-53]
MPATADDAQHGYCYPQGWQRAVYIYSLLSTCLWNMDSFSESVQTALVYLLVIFASNIAAESNTLMRKAQRKEGLLWFCCMVTSGLVSPVIHPHMGVPMIIMSYSLERDHASAHH